MLTFIWLYLVVQSTAEYTDYCKESNSRDSVFRLTYENTTGQVMAEWCTEAKENDTLQFNLHFIDVTETECIAEDKNENLNIYSDLHSIFSDRIDSPLNCGYVCHWKKLNKVFTGCYMATEEIWNDNSYTPKPALFHYVTSVDRSDVSTCKVTAFAESVGNNLSVTWYMDQAPVTAYEDMYGQMYIWSLTENKPVSMEGGGCPVEAGGRRVACEVALPFGQYRCDLLLHEPWTIGNMFKGCQRFTYDYCNHPAPTELPAGGGTVGGAGPWVAGCACAGLALGALAALVLWDKSSGKRFSAYILQLWTNWRHTRADSDTGAVGGSAGGGAGPVLVLYARDCEPALRLARALCRLLGATVPGQVFDLFDPRVKHLCADKPTEWVRELIETEGSRVVLLETPAASALFAPALTHAPAGQITVSSPLLWRRVAYREPDSQDAALQRALDQLRVTAHHHHQYQKYYVVRVDGLQDEEVLKHVAPFVRYSLPSTAHALLHDLITCPPAAPSPSTPDTPTPTTDTTVMIPSGAVTYGASSPSTPIVRLPEPGPTGEIPADLMAELEMAAAELLQYIATNPNYLAELTTTHAPLDIAG